MAAVAAAGWPATGVDGCRAGQPHPEKPGSSSDRCPVWNFSHLLTPLMAAFSLASAFIFSLSWRTCLQAYAGAIA